MSFIITTSFSILNCHLPHFISASSSFLSLTFSSHHLLLLPHDLLISLACSCCCNYFLRMNQNQLSQLSPLLLGFSSRKQPLLIPSSQLTSPSSTLGPLVSLSFNSPSAIAALFFFLSVFTAVGDVLLSPLLSYVASSLHGLFWLSFWSCCVGLLQLLPWTKACSSFVAESTILLLVWSAICGSCYPWCSFNYYSCSFTSKHQLFFLIPSCHPNLLS